RPSPREAVDGENALLHRDAPLARGELPQALLRTLRGHAIDADLPLATAPVEAEPQEGPPPRPGHRGLVAVDLELEAALDEPRDALHHALPRALAADVDPSVVGVAHEAVPALVELPVEVVEHDVAEQRRERGALWRPLLAGVHQP